MLITITGIAVLDILLTIIIYALLIIAAIFGILIVLPITIITIFVIIVVLGIAILALPAIIFQAILEFYDYIITKIRNWKYKREWEKELKRRN